MTATVQELESRIAALRQELAAVRRADAGPIDPSVTNAEFRTVDDEPITLRELFGDKSELLLIHNMGKSCPYCTLWADGFIGLSPHLNDRCAFVLASPDAPDELREFAASRPMGGWPFRCVSYAGNGLAREMGFEPKPDQFEPGVSAFHLNDDGTIERTGRADFGPGDDYCVQWHLLDLLKDGAAGWSPKYQY